MSTDAAVAAHYGKEGLEEKILQGLATSGTDIERLTPRDLAPVDELHVGGIESTEALAAQMELRPGLHLLDVGCGIGGPARYFASEHGCDVTGIDLTDEFVRTADSLTRRLKLDHLVRFRQGSAVDLPFEAASFDTAYMIHVGMNIADKAGICREVRRVLKPGGLFAVFDIMRTSDGPMRYPVPWALTEETSHVATVKSYRDGLEAAGLHVVHERNRTEFGIEFTRQVMARMASGAPGFGFHRFMGELAPLMIGNLQEMMEQGTLAPVELIAR